MSPPEPPESRPRVSPSRVSRRAALTGGVAVLGTAVVGACTPTGSEAGRRRRQPRPVEPEVDPDVAIAASALAEQRVVLALLDATTQRHPRLGATLSPAVETHEAHVAVLADAVPEGVDVTPSSSSSPSPSAGPSSSTGSSSPSSDTSSSGAPVRVPGRRSAALAAVAEAERELGTTMKRHAFKAESGAFARVLGSMAAAAAQTATVLDTAQGVRS